MKRAFVVLSVIAFLLSLVSCMSHIEDDNGDDTSLCTLTERDIIECTSSLSYKSVKNKTNDKGNVRVDKFSGVQVVDSITVKEENKIVTCSVNITSGNLRVVIVRDGEIFADIKTDGEESSVALTRSGRYTLKIAGESACFDLEYEIN